MEFQVGVGHPRIAKDMKTKPNAHQFVWSRHERQVWQVDTHWATDPVDGIKELFEVLVRGFREKSSLFWQMKHA